MYKNMLKIVFVCWMLLCSQDAFSQRNATSISDPEITINLNNKLSPGGLPQGTNIKKTTSNGMVNVYGNVDSQGQANTVSEIAQSTPGVKSVNASNLNIKKDQQPVADGLILMTTKIIGKGLFHLD